MEKIFTTKFNEDIIKVGNKFFVCDNGCEWVGEITTEDNGTHYDYIDDKGTKYWLRYTKYDDCDKATFDTIKDLVENEFDFSNSLVLKRYKTIGKVIDVIYRSVMSEEIRRIDNEYIREVVREFAHTR